MGGLATEDILRYLVSPVVIGAIGSGLAALINTLKDRSEMKRTNREMQVMKAVEICGKVIEAADDLHSRMKHDAWNIAWRNARPEKYNNNDKEKAMDVAKWNEYIQSLDRWRKHEITYETELKGSFGDTGYEAFLFQGIVKRADECAGNIWTVYTKAETVMVFKEGIAVVEKRASSWTEEDQVASMEMNFENFEEMRNHIAMLSLTMIHCIQNLNIGNLSLPGQVIPVPESKLKLESEMKSVSSAEKKGKQLPGGVYGRANVAEA